ncbi:MAG: hypothetical protein RBS46_07280 [Methyloversatilis sp.]|nr:hypothetical protein [Methyloversatilis sp.]
MITVVVMRVRGRILVHDRATRQTVVRWRAAHHRGRGKPLQGQCQQQHDGQQETGHKAHDQKNISG